MIDNAEDLATKAQDNKAGLKRKYVNIPIGDEEYGFRISGIGAKSVKLEKFVKYDEIFEAIEAGNDNGLESMIKQIIEDYEEWIKQREEAKKKAFYDAIIKPAKFMSLPKLVFRQSKPAIIGVEALSGTVKQGQKLINKNGESVGIIASMEDKGETLPDISRGQRVAMAIDNAIVGKDFDEGDELFIDIPEKHYKFIEREFKDKLTEDEFETLHEFLEIKRKQDPDWGKFGLFE